MCVVFFVLGTFCSSCRWLWAELNNSKILLDRIWLIVCKSLCQYDCAHWAVSHTTWARLFFSMLFGLLSKALQLWCCTSLWCVHSHTQLFFFCVRYVIKRGLSKHLVYLHELNVIYVITWIDCNLCNYGKKLCLKRLLLLTLENHSVQFLQQGIFASSKLFEPETLLQHKAPRLTARSEVKPSVVSYYVLLSWYCSVTYVLVLFF